MNKNNNGYTMVEISLALVAVLSLIALSLLIHRNVERQSWAYNKKMIYNSAINITNTMYKKIGGCITGDDVELSSLDATSTMSKFYGVMNKSFIGYKYTCSGNTVRIIFTSSNKDITDGVYVLKEIMNSTLSPSVYTVSSVSGGNTFDVSWGCSCI